MNLVINSDTSLSVAIGELRELFRSAKFLRVNVKTGKHRSLDQNAIAHVFYEQIARELREDTPLGVKCYCKLHLGVPILRAEDDEFRQTYDIVIRPLSYERKLEAMKAWPVTSLMSKGQLSQFLEAMQDEFAVRVNLEFPKDAELRK